MSNDASAETLTSVLPAPRSARASSGRYGPCNLLSVLYFPFSETTPSRTAFAEYHTSPPEGGEFIPRPSLARLRRLEGQQPRRGENGPRLPLPRLRRSGQARTGHAALPSAFKRAEWSKFASVPPRGQRRRWRERCGHAADAATWGCAPYPLPPLRPVFSLVASPQAGVPARPAGREQPAGCGRDSAHYHP